MMTSCKMLFECGAFKHTGVCWHFLVAVPGLFNRKTHRYSSKLSRHVDDNERREGSFESAGVRLYFVRISLRFGFQVRGLG